ncbi:hypothetical protein MNBD_ACTINO02-2123 [hydrothermal vent metagenome]|uniref:Uncharacterized protein n=1 Tax=hydrothermal vent metagenome TaxID=652676 RepID=A0A3B0SVP1_9ZZZZ
MMPYGSACGHSSDAPTVRAFDPGTMLGMQTRYLILASLITGLVILASFVIVMRMSFT